MSDQKFKMGSPEWQLAEAVKSKRHVAMTYRADSERMLRKASEIEEEADAYERALNVLRAHSPQEHG